MTPWRCQLFHRHHHKRLDDYGTYQRWGCGRCHRTWAVLRHQPGWPPRGPWMDFAGKTLEEAEARTWAAVQ
jgi:hypothetical protein